MNTLPFLSIEKIAIAKAKEELVLKLLADEARVLEEKKVELRAKAKADGLTDAEIDALIPPCPADVFSI